jgi:hypothetical protein
MAPWIVAQAASKAACRRFARRVALDQRRITMAAVKSSKVVVDSNPPEAKLKVGVIIKAGTGAPDVPHGCVVTMQAGAFTAPAQVTSAPLAASA